MLSSRQPIKVLSKNLRKMKFMQKQQDELLAENQKKEYDMQLSKEHWFVEDMIDIDLRTAPETESSFVICEDLLSVGRMSFRNFNPKIEKLYSGLLSKHSDHDKDAESGEEDVSVAEMADRYDSLVDSIGKKFSRKRKHQQHEHCRDPDQTISTTSKPKKIKRVFKKPKME
ncbi:M-phase phosphoprotein 6-like [Rhopilema esculentum]|uniref:M-phase phosphoprotein 6-like n=1 Tax=Rhopilema esculentum TaxID=499914 RepID=UPI0031D54EAE